MTTVSKSHPWITFEFDLGRIDFRTWLLLGEAQSKCEHVAGLPLRPATARTLNEIYLAKGALATTAIEGNTLTEEEVRKRVEGKLELATSREYLGQEIDNIVSACNEIIGALEDGTGELTREQVMRFNELVLTKVPVEPYVTPGKIRVVDVGAPGYSAPRHDECAELFQRTCEWLNGPELREESAHGIAFAIIRAVLAHVYLVWIHPFGDGNGRTARLVEFYLLIQAGVPAPSAHLLSDHYNRTRAEYYRQLRAASLSGGDLVPFLKYAVQGFLDGLREQVGRIREQQWDVTWRNYVHEGFRDKKTAADERRRHLALDISSRPEGVLVSELRALTPRLAAAYANRQQKTITRDLNVLEKMRLVDRHGPEVRARREMILAFLPARKERAKPK